MTTLHALAARFDRITGHLIVTTARGSVEFLLSRYEAPDGSECFALLRLAGDTPCSRVEVRLDPPACSCGVEPCEHLDSLQALKAAGRID